MSGIVGIVNLDGAPVQRGVLQRLTSSLSFRGPDAQNTCLAGCVGFGLASLDAHHSPDRPFCQDDDLRIVADARVDGRAELIASLRSRGQQRLEQASDAALILRAYQVWGDRCLEHLIGDFAFAIWDGPRRRLFCARDQMGVKPFFYAHLGSLLVFSNTLNCIRRHPAVSDRLNDLSIADFLLFELQQDPEATAFVDIKRLPPAHSLICEQGRVSVARYWTPPLAGPIFLRRPADYVEQFCELLDAAVADRLRAESACIFMSGGLDSPTVAASAKRVSARDGDSCSLWAYTQVFDSLIPHEERHYAGLVAHALGIPIEYRADDNLRLFQFAEQPEHLSPEPVNTSWPDVTADQLKRVSTVSRVVLAGYGADPLFSSRITVHFRQLLQRKQFGQALADAARYLTAEGRLSRLYLRTRLRILFASKEAQTGAFPPWLNQDFVKRLALRERWEAFSVLPPPPQGAVRPEAYEVTYAPLWADLFNLHDPGVTGVPVEVRFPFFDLRLMKYLLALPRLPWCCDKQMLREAGRGVLPDAVRLRRKSPLQADPLVKLIQRAGASASRFTPLPELEEYVASGDVQQSIEKQDSWTTWVHFRPQSLNYWLLGLRSSPIKVSEGADHDFVAQGPFS